jgi:hypothetical protein
MEAAAHSPHHALPPTSGAALGSGAMTLLIANRVAQIGGAGGCGRCATARGH